MRFRYPLQKIVDLKGSEKSMAEWEYASSIQKLREEEERLADIRAERKRIEERLMGAASGRVTLAELSSLQAYLDALDDRIKRQTDNVVSAEAAVRDKQGRLAKKTVEEKVWLNAREKAHEAFQYIRNAKQQNELDEIATIRAAASRG